MATTGSNVERIGSYNQVVVLDAIRRFGPISRVEIAQRTQLSAQTVTNIVRRLLLDGDALEVGKSFTSGKPRTLIELAANSSCAFGVHLDPSHTTVALLNVHGSPLSQRSLETADSNPEEVVGMIADAIIDITQELELTSGNVLGIGVGVPGPVAIETGVMTHPTHLPQWRGFSLRDELEKATGLPVIIEKDVVVSAVAQRWLSEDPHESAVTVYVGTGIGAGMTAEGRVVRGSSGNSGAVAHIIVDTGPDAVTCRCGRRGCITVTSSPFALISRAQQSGMDLPGNSRQEQIAALFTLATTGEPRAKSLIHAAMEGLASMCLVLVDLHEPDRLILGGPFWPIYRAPFSETFTSLVQNAPHDSALRSVEITESSLVDELGAVGAGLIVLDRKFTPKLEDFAL